MDYEKLIAILPHITSELAEKIQIEYNISEDEAISILYASKLYEALEQEKTKVWQFSTEMLWEVYQQEMEQGIIDFPEC